MRSATWGRVGVALVGCWLAACAAPILPAPTLIPAPVRVIVTPQPPQSPSPEPTPILPTDSFSPTPAPVTPPVEPSPTPTFVTPTSTPVPSGQSGIAGEVWLGPMCPVVHVESPCPDQPYAASLVVVDQVGAVVVRFMTDAAGRFAVSLLPGTYTLIPESPPGSPLPAASPQTVVVAEGQVTWVVVYYDTGIR